MIYLSFSYRYLQLAQDFFGIESLKTSDVHNAVSLHYFKTRRFERALVDAQRALDIRKINLGDYWHIPPNDRVADSYSNVGLLLRLTGEEMQQPYYF